MGKHVSLIGRVIGRLTVVSAASCPNTATEKQRKQKWWRLRCECGKEIVRPSKIMTNGTTRSCGCLFLEQKRAAIALVRGRGRRPVDKTYQPKVPVIRAPSAPRPGSPWTPEVLQRLRDDHAAGYSTPEIGRRLGVSKNAVVSKCRGLGLPQRENVVGRAIGEEKTKAAEELIISGMPAIEIAEIVGIHPDTVHGMRKRMGIVLPPKTRQSRSAPRFVVGPRGPAVPVLFTETVSIPAPRPVIVRPEPRPAPPPIDRTRTCEWLSGERWHYVRCEHPVVRGTSWCTAHYAVVFVRRLDREAA